MNLHRIEGRPEWASVPVARRNPWQRLAAATYGIITIGNFFSLLGLLSVPAGLVLASQDRLLAAVIVLMAGRACDLLDGLLADKTGTKSPLGEKIDASFDKVSTAATIIGVVLLGFVPAVAALILVGPHLLIALVVLVAYFRGIRLHPSVAGKLSMALLWVTMVALLLPVRYSPPGEALLETIVALLFVVAVLTGLFALGGYISSVMRQWSKPDA
jgi:CDP-diacylglycerol---glycerol-3-phosphate 3-phosphatidyltransferase